MAKQKKVQSRRVPHASNPRMYGDGKSSETKDSAQAAAPAVQTPGAGSTNVSSTASSAGAKSRTSTGAGGSYARGGLNTTSDYTYVKQDLRRLGVVAVSIIGVLVVLAIAIP